MSFASINIWSVEDGSEKLKTCLHSLPVPIGSSREPYNSKPSSAVILINDPKASNWPKVGESATK